MKTTYLNKLEYNKILNILATFCHTYIGKNIALSLFPSNDFNEVKHSLSETEEAVNLISRNSTPPISEIADITVYLKALESYSTISAKALLDICNILQISNELKDFFNVPHISKEEFSNLNIYFSALYSNFGIIEKIKKAIIDENTLSDTASSNLNIIRKKQRKLEQDIKNKLNTIIHSSSYSKYIQENVVTIRNDRFVIPVKEEYRSSIKGFIHDISSSGSTVFIEPISVFEFNNELNNLKLEENAEIEKILQNLSTMLFPYVEELKTDINIIGNLDFIFAKAKYSNTIKGITPIINTEKYINLINARHPLIDTDKVVSNSITLGKDYSTLVITGPNTGGKTVTLKTVGLLICMACSGLNIPCSEKSSIFVFDEVFADIGDDQSISESLSTFSSHMINIVDIINNSTPKSLVLVDELGSGTDPLEGANLAISILEHFKDLGILTISTTHYQELKKYALVTKKVQNASVEFNIEDLKPTYKLLIGIPGKSNAFAISKKLGLPDAIINKASSMLSSNDINIEDLLKNIYDNKANIEDEKEQINKELEKISILRKNLEKDNSDLEKQRKDLITNAKYEARKILLDAKDEADNIIKEMTSISTSNSKLNELRKTLNEKIKDNTIINTATPSANSLNREDIKINLPVFVTTLNKEALIVSNISKSDEVQVQIGSMKTNVNIKYLEKSKNTNKHKNISVSHTSISKTKTAASEINIIGLTVDEALPIVDKFLDDSYLSKLDTVRIVHGKGTGKLKNGVHQFIKKHPHVKDFRMGTFGEGEMGVTVVSLK